MKLLNIGCGSHFHPLWLNIDIAPSSPDVLAFDIMKKLPFADNSFDVVYHSHVIEHLTSAQAALFLHDAVRILKPDGIMRIATPNLEKIVQLYLEKLEDVLNGRQKSHEYDWMLLELFDQIAREIPGGRMGQYLREHYNDDFVLSRIGHEALNYWMTEGQHIGLLEKITKKPLAEIIARLRSSIALSIVGFIAGTKTKRACAKGLFRDSGEIHRWLYDRYSLKRLMATAGLKDIKTCSAFESRIQDFNSFGLDVVNGKTRKPDSLFMEGKKN